MKEEQLREFMSCDVVRDSESWGNDDTNVDNSKVVIFFRGFEELTEEECCDLFHPAMEMIKENYKKIVDSKPDKKAVRSSFNMFFEMLD